MIRLKVSMKKILLKLIRNRQSSQPHILYTHKMDFIHMLFIIKSISPITEMNGSFRESHMVIGDMQLFNLYRFI